MILAACFAAMMALVLFVGTPWGLGLSADSVSYAMAARALAERHDLMQLPTHWPPLLPMMLAGVYALTGDFNLSGRLLQAAFLAINVLLIHRLLGFTGQSRAMKGLLLVLIVLQPGFLSVHLVLLSEPAFLSLVLLDLLLLAEALRGSSTRRWLLALALTSGLAIMDRYAGLFLLVVNAGALLFLGAMPRRLTDRLKDVMVLSLLTLAPMLVWSVFNRIRTGHASDRSLAWHPAGKEHIVQGIDTLADWFHLPGAFGWLVLLCIVLAAFWSIRPGKTDDMATNAGIARVMSLYLFTYPVFLLVSISLIDFIIPLDARLLIPMLPVTIVLFAYITREAEQRRLPLLLLGAMIIGLTLNVPESYQLWRQSRINGLGFANRHIQTLPIMSTLKQMPPAWKVATNGPELFELYLRQRAYMLPAKKNPGSQRVNPAYAGEIRSMLRTSDALVYFAPMRYRYYLPSAEELNRLPDFRLVYAQPDGDIWIKNKIVSSGTSGTRSRVR